MRDRSGMALRVEADRLYLLDQSRLPQEQRWLAIDDVDALVEQMHRDSDMARRILAA